MLQLSVQPDAVLQEALVELRSNGNNDEHATKRKPKFANPNTKVVNKEKKRVFGIWNRIKRGRHGHKRKADQVMAEPVPE